jgi:hypothetical protein
MGTLKPNATYIYERVGDTVYARESGSLERHPVGWGFDRRPLDKRPLYDRMMDDKLWGEIRRAAPTNPALQKALDRAIMIYRLSKDNPQ